MQKESVLQKLHKPIKCPLCGRRLMDENFTSNSQIIINPIDDGDADYYLKCPKCTAEVGIRKIE